MPTTAKQFNANLKRVSRILLPQQVGLLQRKVALDLLARVVKKTPVDTGRARGNWQLNIATPKKTILDIEDKNGGPTVTKGLGDLATHLPYITIYLTNNVPYIKALEEGHSKAQAPHGMLAISIEEVNSSLIT